jgi:hypothetical protein
MSMVSQFIAHHAPSIQMSSVGSDDSSLSGYGRRLAYPKSHIEVHLDNHYKSKVYTNGSPVSGHVTIVTQRDVRFDSIQVVLMGTSRTRVDGVGSPAESTHVFLKLAMPIPESTYPVPRVLETGHRYRIPFNFIVPSYLTIGACNHHLHSDQLQDHHVRLPPTMGSWQQDDMAPDMAQVEYSVKARVYRLPEVEEKHIKVMEATHEIRVLPASPEDPPLSISKNDREYRMSKSKTIRKNLLSGKLGKLTATAVQPEAVSLLPDGRGMSSTTAHINLGFEPAAPGASPPKVTNVSAKVAAHTYYASGGIPVFPNFGDWAKSFGIEKRGSYSTSVSLLSQAVDKFKWTSHVNAQARRDSGYETTAYSDEEEQQQQQQQQRSGSRRMRTKAARNEPAVYHTATLQVPIKLPLGKKMFIPTFHSCIISRVYVLRLEVTLGSGSGASTLSLYVPLQVGVDMDYSQQQGMEGLPSFETALEEAEVDEYLRPRVLAVPDAQYQQTSALPGYADLAQRGGQQRISVW